MLGISFKFVAVLSLAHPTSECALCVWVGADGTTILRHTIADRAIDFKLFVRVRVLVGTLWLCRQLQQQWKWQEPK